MRPLIIALSAVFVLLAGAGAEAAGRFVDLGLVQSIHVAPRRVVVWLPDGYDATTSRYAVLYMHDGRNLFDPKTSYGGEPWAVDVAIDQLRASDGVRPTLVVGVDNTPARQREYMPGRVFDALPEGERTALAAEMKGAPLSDDYLKFLVFELKPLIDARFRTRPDRSSTFIMGSSMGGLISLYAIAEYPDVFGGAGCLSTHWPLPAFTMSGPKLAQAPVLAAFDSWLKARLGPPQGRRVWFDHGDKTLDQFYAPYQLHIDETLAGLGWSPGRDFESRAYAGAAHNEPSWRARLADPLRFLLSDQVKNNK